MATGDGRLSSTRSLDVVFEEVRFERSAQLQHFDALDAKADIVLGFAGAIVVLAPSHHVLAGIGRLIALVGGLLPLLSFLPRKLGLTNVYALRQKYLAAEPQFSRLALLDAQISMIESTRTLIRRRALLLTLAMGWLALGIVFIGLGIPVH